MHRARCEVDGRKTPLSCVATKIDFTGEENKRKPTKHSRKNKLLREATRQNLLQVLRHDDTGFYLMYERRKPVSYRRKNVFSGTNVFPGRGGRGGGGYSGSMYFCSGL